MRHKETIHRDDSSDDKLQKDELTYDPDIDESDMESDSHDKEETIDPWYDMVGYCYKLVQPEFDTITLEYLNDDDDLNEKQAR